MNAWGDDVSPIPHKPPNHHYHPLTHPKSSSGTPPHPSLSSSTLDKADQMLKSTESLSSKKGVSLRSRSELIGGEKLEELKQHALSAQKFRLQQELERRRHIEELRLRDTDKRHQVEERKKALEEAERDRRVALLRKNKEREERIEPKKTSTESNELRVWKFNT
ncbi:unnamed protein product [Lepeophtheirus salmonis]|uniref:(salmon louse) hypothetical protein n=2 Tax=Lepeophtheirus salmonis TaxID=72036 RepID=A0A7R8D352_LEPSM|nr:unnamed protein product [Lepeophtheirus salmonis]CAF3013656.1 unnamed protein product [Lepeophtheirus salmonis]